MGGSYPLVIVLVNDSAIQLKMATKRFTKTAVDFAAFAARVPERDKANFIALKAKHDAYMRKMAQLPEAAPAISWDLYASRISIPGLVDSFKKQYESLTVPYPKDSQNMVSEVDAQEEKANAALAQFKTESNARIAGLEGELKNWQEMIPLNEMTMEELKIHFPDYVGPFADNPKFFPENTADDLKDEDYYHKQHLQEEIRKWSKERRSDSKAFMKTYGM